jgi:hypothetical protein
MYHHGKLERRHDIRIPRNPSGRSTALSGKQTVVCFPHTLDAKSPWLPIARGLNNPTGADSITTPANYWLFR